MCSFFTHVYCVSQSMSDSGRIDVVEMLIPVASGISSYNITNLCKEILEQLCFMFVVRNMNFG